MSIGEKMRIERARQRMSQKELADRSGIKRPIISLIENELVEPGMKWKKQILLALGCDDESSMVQ